MTAIQRKSIYRRGRLAGLLLGLAVFGLAEAYTVGVAVVAVRTAHAETAKAAARAKALKHQVRQLEIQNHRQEVCLNDLAVEYLNGKLSEKKGKPGDE